MGTFATKQSVFTVLLVSLGVGVALHAKTLQFELTDCYGRTVSSQDYAGVPLFLEFGACW